MLSFALYQCKGPVVIRYPRGSQSLDPNLLQRPRLRSALPKPELLSSGSDLTIAAVGNMTGIAIEAHARLTEMNIHASVIDVRCLKPLDTAFILEHARQSGLLLTIEENVLNGGLAEHLALEIAKNGENIHLQPLAIGDHPVLQASQKQALASEGLTADSIVEAVLHLITDKKHFIHSK